MTTLTEPTTEARPSAEPRPRAESTPRRRPSTKPAEPVTAYDEIWFDRRPLH